MIPSFLKEISVVFYVYFIIQQSVWKSNPHFEQSLNLFLCKLNKIHFRFFSSLLYRRNRSNNPSFPAGNTESISSLPSRFFLSHLLFAHFPHFFLHIFAFYSKICIFPSFSKGKKRRGKIQGPCPAAAGNRINTFRRPFRERERQQELPPSDPRQLPRS